MPTFQHFKHSDIVRTGFRSGPGEVVPGDPDQIAPAEPIYVLAPDPTGAHFGGGVLQGFLPGIVTALVRRGVNAPQYAIRLFDRGPKAVHVDPRQLVHITQAEYDRIGT